LRPNATIIQLNVNVDFSMGNNILSKKAVDDGAEYLFILNHDMILDTNGVIIPF